MTQAPEGREAVLTEDHPETGFISDHGVLLARAVRWEQDGMHVIRSTEFDLIASGPTLDDAVSNFEIRLRDYFSYLFSLAKDEVATETEISDALRIAERFAAVVEALDAELDSMKEGFIQVRVNWPWKAPRSPSHRKVFTSNHETLHATSVA